MRQELQKIPSYDHYPLPRDLTINPLKDFVPQLLQLFISRLMYLNAFNDITIISDECETVRRRMLSVRECLIFCSKIDQVIPPAHRGLAFQLEFEA